MVSLPRPLTPRITLRKATPSDIPRLVAMNHAAYPELVEQNVVWSPAQIAAHIDRFAQGQIVAEVDGDIMGAISTFIVPATRNALAQHTWLAITDEGTFASHDGTGDTLYLADVYVDPAAWGKGVGEALYGAMKQLCVELGLRRVVAGGRLWGYHEYADRLTAKEYVDIALRGDIRDRVLGSQLKAGFRVCGILEHYLKDPRSKDYATLLVWNAPPA